jgi:hypothetical protein
MTAALTVTDLLHPETITAAPPGSRPHAGSADERPRADVLCELGPLQRGPDGREGTLFYCSQHRSEEAVAIEATAGGSDAPLRTSSRA